MIRTLCSRGTQIGKGGKILYYSLLRASGDPYGIVMGMFILSFPGSEPIGKGGTPEPPDAPHLLRFPGEQRETVDDMLQSIICLLLLRRAVQSLVVHSQHGTFSVLCLSRSSGLLVL